MILAIPYDSATQEVFGHFGRTKQFMLCTIEDEKVVGTHILDAGPEGHGALIGLLIEAGVNAVVAGGMGPGAVEGLKEGGIAVYTGVTGPCDEVAKAFAEGKIQQNSDPTCDHHGEGEGHSCHDHSHGCHE